MLKAHEVINPYADKVHLPEEAHKIRRQNSLYQAFVKAITLLHQYQRRKDGQWRLVSEKEDLQVAPQIMFESILLKVDELDGTLRQFYEQLACIKSNGNDHYEFSQGEVRQSLHVSKTQTPLPARPATARVYPSILWLRPIADLVTRYCTRTTLQH